jgi:hypothetical protein
MTELIDHIDALLAAGEPDDHGAPAALVCPWCEHQWHGLDCWSCRCDTASARLDETWRPHAGTFANQATKEGLDGYSTEALFVWEAERQRRRHEAQRTYDDVRDDCWRPRRVNSVERVMAQTGMDGYAATAYVRGAIGRLWKVMRDGFVPVMAQVAQVGKALGAQFAALGAAFPRVIIKVDTGPFELALAKLQAAFPSTPVEKPVDRARRQRIERAMRARARRAARRAKRVYGARS